MPGMDIARQGHASCLKFLNSINSSGEKVNDEDMLDEFSCIINDSVPVGNAAASTSGYSNTVN
jgi:hypothetical protein